MKFELNNKNNKGITLIVLVITIIVLLILTAVTFTYLFGEDGLVQKAKWGKFATEFREIEERVEIYVVDKQIEELQNGVQLETGEKVYPVSSKLTMEEKQAIKANKSELAVKIMQLTEKEVEEVNLYWIEQEKIGTNKKDRYLIDIDTNQIYQYEGKTIYGLKWHTLDDGVKIGSRVPVDSEELWDGWIRITLYYPSNSTERQWRLGQEGETRYDKTLMWQDYTGPIWVRLTDVENVWIKYKIDGEEQIVAPNGRLAVDIQPDSYLPTLKESVKVKIYYDKEAELKEYKIGNSEWQEYTEEFIVTENTIVEARAKKKVKISDDTGEVIGEKEIWGRDNVYIGNIGIEEADLPAPTLKRKEADSSVEGEVAKVEASYPEEAVRKIYKINYGEEKEYTEEISIKRYGTYIIAYYYNNEGKRSRAAQILINDPSTGSTSSSGRYVPNGSGWPGGGNSGSGGGSGSTGSNPTTPSYVIEAPNISVNPTTVTDSVQVTIRPTGGHTAEKIYYKIGYGSYQEYTTSISLTYNTTVRII